MSKHLSVGGRARRLWLSLPALALAASIGCGTADPVAALRDLGANVHLDKDGEPVTVDFPDDAADEDLEHLKGLRALEELDLSGTEISGEGLKALDGLERLERLDLRDTPVGDEGMKHLADLSDDLAGLEVLYIGDTNVTDQGLKELARIDSLKQVFLTRAAEPTRPAERSWKDAINLGIDLAGGTNLVFQIAETPDKPITGDVMDQMVAAVSRRINPSGTEEVTVRQVGGDRIEIIIPGADPEYVERIKDRVSKLGSLEFAILASRQDAGHEEIIRQAERTDARDVEMAGRVVATWRPVGIDLNTGSPKDVGEYVERVGQAVTRIARDKYGRPQLAPDGSEIKEFLLVLNPDPERRVTGEHLSNVRQGTDSRTGGLAVDFSFNIRGAFLFQELTSLNTDLPGNRMNRLAILLDDQIHSAPSIQSMISDSGQITGDFTAEEVQELIKVLNAGALKREIVKEPVSEFTISPTLGEDVQNKGRFAILVSAAAVVVFMAAYYLVAGFVADMCLVLNLVLIMGAMALIDATFTLPGLAGIVLTIGMAVDANVLIFERIREERTRGSSLRMSIHNGFSRALSAIIDSNLTTLITAVVLYTIGTDQIRGFAVTLFIGIIMSLFTSLYFGRLVFEIIERKRWIRDLKMLRVVGVTHWHFINKWKIAAACSVVVISLGMGTFIVRGQDNLDIDFSGGTMLTFEFKEPHETAQVRERLETAFGESVTLENLVIPGQELSIGEGTRFRVRSRKTDVPEVKRTVARTFGDELIDVKLTAYEKVAAAEPPADEAEGDEPAADEAEARNVYRLTFSAPMREATVSGNLASELEKLTEPATGEPTEDGRSRPKYEKAETLFEVRGVLETQDEQGGSFRELEVIGGAELVEADFVTAIEGMQRTLDEEPRFEGVNSFAAAVAVEMQQSAVLAMLISMAAIVAYLWFRFQRISYGLATMAAVVHDVLFVLGSVAVAGYLAGQLGVTALGLDDFRIDLPMVAAFLTLVGYSLNDTIVVFDRIREVRGKSPIVTREMIDISLNQTLARTILTSLTTLMVVSILYIWGGEAIHGFAFCLVVGMVVGTYSTIYVAAPVLLWLMNRTAAATPRGTAQPQAAART
ncbi:MAG: protein translocase subunit SecD [Planctomycetes bacterium]|nr:protein translocase subunit SecD [Planctomycetota bacterium]